MNQKIFKQYKPRRENKEYILCKQIAAYLRLKYPKVLFHFDSSGMYHTPVQSKQMKAIQHSKGFPDLFIAKARVIKTGSKFPNDYEVYAGLFIELKAEGTRLTNCKGNYATPHIAEQAEVLERLRDAGYKAEFGIGYDETVKIIDEYLK